jgi:hypothetical protein
VINRVEVSINIVASDIEMSDDDLADFVERVSKQIREGFSSGQLFSEEVGIANWEILPDQQR